MKVIGLTGGIGSGKSTVSKFLAELGAVIIDADKVGHEAFQPGTDAWREVVAAFGTDILDEKGYIDRHKLGRKVFGNGEEMSRLNQIMHPRMFETVKQAIGQYRAKGTRVVVLEATLLIEAGWRPLVDEVWVTIAPEQIIIQRLRERSGLSEGEALARIRSQVPPQERLKHADVVIDTNCSLDDLKTEIQTLWEKLKGES